MRSPAPAEVTNVKDIKKRMARMLAVLALIAVAVLAYLWLHGGPVNTLLVGWLVGIAIPLGLVALALSMADKK